MHAREFLRQTAQIAGAIDADQIERVASGLAAMRNRGGRLFLLGVGGSAANCSHAVCDFRKLAGIQAFTPCDNVAELTARINDDGWESVFEMWLRASDAGPNDALMVLSVGGGDAERGVSPNLVRALDEARRRGMPIYGIVGRDGGYARKVGDDVIVVPTADPAHVTPHTEAFQAVVWHCLVCHPVLQRAPMKWEALGERATGPGSGARPR